MNKKICKDNYYHNLDTLRTLKLPRINITDIGPVAAPFGIEGQLTYNLPTQSLWYNDGLQWIELFGTSNFVLSIPSDTRRLHIGESDDVGTDWDQGQPQDPTFNNILIHSPDSTVFNEWLEFRTSSGAQGMVIRSSTGDVLGNNVTDPGFIPGSGHGTQLSMQSGWGGQLGGSGGSLILAAGPSFTANTNGGDLSVLAGGTSGINSIGGDLLLGSGPVTSAGATAGDVTIFGGADTSGDAGSTAGNLFIRRGLSTGGSSGNVFMDNLPSISALTLGTEPVAPVSVTGAVFKNADRISIAPSPLAFVFTRLSDESRGGTDFTITAPNAVDFFNGNATRDVMSIYVGFRRCYIDNPDDNSTLFINTDVKIPFNAAYTFDFSTISGGGGYTGGNPSFYNPSAWSTATIEMVTGGTDDLRNTVWDPTPGANNPGFFQIPKTGFYRIHFDLVLDMRRAFISTDGAGIMSVSSTFSFDDGPDDTFYIFIDLYSRADGTINLSDFARATKTYPMEKQTGTVTWSNWITFEYTDYFRAGEVFTINFRTTLSSNQVLPQVLISTADLAGVESYKDGLVSTTLDGSMTYRYFDLDGNTTDNKLDIVYLGLLP